HKFNTFLKIHAPCFRLDPIFLIPSSIFFAYRHRHPVGAVKGGREDFTILRNDNRYIRHEAKCEDEDITRYFIPNPENHVNVVK
ncbi:hypothetical protein, partial [Duncaniella muris]|uniref:hypothetical protein n=2 Tax=Duncaniella muris TaxID=2094150 RepID=UPI0026751600